MVQGCVKLSCIISNRVNEPSERPRPDLPTHVHMYACSSLAFPDKSGKHIYGDKIGNNTSNVH